MPILSATSPDASSCASTRTEKRYFAVVWSQIRNTPDFSQKRAPKESEILCSFLSVDARTPFSLGSTGSYHSFKGLALPSTTSTGRYAVNHDGQHEENANATSEIMPPLRFFYTNSLQPIRRISQILFQRKPLLLFRAHYPLYPPWRNPGWC